MRPQEPKSKIWGVLGGYPLIGDLYCDGCDAADAAAACLLHEESKSRSLSSATVLCEPASMLLLHTMSVEGS